MNIQPVNVMKPIFTPTQTPIPVYSAPVVTMQPQVPDSFVSTTTLPAGIIAPKGHVKDPYAGLGKPLSPQEQYNRNVQDLRKPMYVQQPAAEVNGQEDNMITLKVEKNGLIAKFAEFIESLKKQVAEKCVCDCKCGCECDDKEEVPATPVEAKTEAPAPVVVPATPVEVKAEAPAPVVVPATPVEVKAEVPAPVAVEPEVKKAEKAE